MPTSQDIGPQQHDPSRFFSRQWVTDAGRMAAHQVQLKLSNVGSRDPLIGQFAESRCDAIDRIGSGRNVANHTIRGRHPPLGCRSQPDLPSLKGHCVKLRNR
jgi:hypothetical protein